MRVSEYYGLGVGQAALDFVDVDIEGDDPLFVDPRALRLSDGAWASDCVSLIQVFFDAVVAAIREGNNDQAIALLASLREPNETHLGLSSGRARGMALGPGTAELIWRALSQSEAIQTGLIADLEETALMIPGIAYDRISDITTNLIRGPLIDYTQVMCEQHAIPTEDQDSGPLWDAENEQWFSKMVKLPRTPSGRLLLIPKFIVRHGLYMNYGEYFHHYVLTHLQDAEISAGTELVRTLKDGRKRVTKKDLKAKYGEGKIVAEEITHQFPQILAEYRAKKDIELPTPPSQEDLAITEGEANIEWDALLAAVVSLPSGTDAADAYHRAVQNLLTALFGPYLSFPNREFKIHDGRKRVDIAFSNTATKGFFAWVSQHYPAAIVMFECKNYGRDVSNPELDQLAGRFSPSRGQHGILVCREFDDKNRFLERCRDTARDGRGYIMPLDDDDLRALCGLRKARDLSEMWNMLRQRFETLLT
jgi:hypothetical protein